MLERHQEQLRNCGKHDLNFLLTEKKKEKKRIRKNTPTRSHTKQNQRESFAAGGGFLQTPMNRDLQAKLEEQQQQQQQQHDCGKLNLNFLRSYYKRKQKKQKEKTNITKAIFATTDSYRDLQAKLEQQQKQQYDCGKPQNLNFLSSYQKKKTKEAHKRRREKHNNNKTICTDTDYFVPRSSS
jgi:hypothetical protein